MSRLARLLILLALLAAVVAGCGDDAATTAGPGEPEPAAGGDESLEHIHGLGVREGNLYIATHYGLWIAPSGELKAKRFSESRQDIMGFSMAEGERFIGSGHPDPADADQPPNLGLIESRDGGKTWNNISLLGEVDFHVLEAEGPTVYGVNSSDGKLMASTDGGKSWEKQTPPAAVFGLAIDPGDTRHITVSTEEGVFDSSDAGETWRPRRSDVGGLLAWPAKNALYLVGGDGAVQVSDDGGRNWSPSGNIEGQPSAFIASGDELYAALHDGTVKVSTDGGAKWAIRATP